MVLPEPDLKYFLSLDVRRWPVMDTQALDGNFSPVIELSSIHIAESSPSKREVPTSSKVDGRCKVCASTLGQGRYDILGRLYLRRNNEFTTLLASGSVYIVATDRCATNDVLTPAGHGGRILAVHFNSWIR